MLIILAYAKACNTNQDNSELTNHKSQLTTYNSQLATNSLLILGLKFIEVTELAQTLHFKLLCQPTNMR